MGRVRAGWCSVVMVVAAVVVPVVGPDPAVSQVRALTCAVSPTDDGFLVRWSSADDGTRVERTVVERSVATDDGQRPWWWRGRADDGEQSFIDGPLPNGAVDVSYRVTTRAGDVVLDRAVCTVTAVFTCSVTVEAGGYRIDWDGGPKGATVDHVVERDVNPEDIYHWRGRTSEAFFVDDGAPTIPRYRVRARVARAEVTVADCEAVGPLAGVGDGASIVCPVPGSRFTNTWLADRDGGAREHQGVDLFAPRDAPVLAPEGGLVTFFTNRLGGRSFGLRADSGIWYYGAHLQRWVGDDRRVEAGELIAMVGTTGNARHTPPHLHFEIHPAGRGTPTVDPTPITRAACR